MASQTTPSPSPKALRNQGFPVTLGLFAGLLFFLAAGFVSYRNSTFLRDDAKMVAHTHEVIVSLHTILTLMKDAETGQRGFIITGTDRYLDPYNVARSEIEGAKARTRELTRDNPRQQALLDQLVTHLDAKFAELAETIALRRSQGLEAAQAVVLTDQGKTEMQAIRNNIASMIEEEGRLRQERVTSMDGAYRVAIVSGILTTMLGVVLSSAVAYLISRAGRNLRKQEWLQNGKLGLSTAMFGEQNLSELGRSILGFLTKYVDAHAGAIFIKKQPHFERVATSGVPDGCPVPEKFQVGDGLLGKAAGEKTSIRMDNVPEGYLTVGSGLGRGLPRQLIILPAAAEDHVNTVLELGFIHSLDDLAQQFLEQSAEQIGVAVKSALYRENLQTLLEETQRQAEELQAQGEELRVSNEELEEQGRALQESQSRMELQQIEMEQTNAQLEEQTQILEHQKDELVQAKQLLENQARAVELASRYKSDFLANMSHELRTPLNSSLILAKLLAENRGGNLNEEQVKYALTIESAGNDLLALINDVLDLSKIEAGHMEIKASPVRVEDILADLHRMFEPVAGQKKVTLKMHISPDAPEVMETDAQRLVQILKNLLSNALKFTEKGTVSLDVSRATGGRLAFAVQDTGIGIAAEHQRIIFEPFHQADGTTSRKYGGTGLGLSISRELTRLLGGEMQLASTPGQGSTFTVFVPCVHTGAVITQPRTPALAENEDTPLFASGPSLAAKPRAISSPLAVRDAFPRVPDDRERLDGSGRVILTVEDDVHFARIISDLAHEMHFQCLICTTAEEALNLARQYLPSAVVLDIGLPDNSGLFVLERMKGDARTRHIPVHVVSGTDYAQTALALGAVGYMLKPVKREQLVEAFQKLETRLTQKLRRVLVVEDDAVQADALQKLLGSREVETVCASTAAKCLELLKSTTFDCMVLDLSLPDASGFSLLETLSSEEAYAFPPVIVYTGRELNADEEQQLRRYSKSIIIKGAKSPERLLDEVTLFLHQVVANLPPEQQRVLEKSPNRDAALEGRRILIAEDDVRNVFALTSLLEGRGVKLQITRNGREAIAALEKGDPPVDLVLMDIMMPEMDGLTAMREIRKRPEWKKLPIIALTAKAMKDDQERCIAAGANDYLAKPLDVEKLLSLIRVWMPR
ncbi:signal transduction histidine kinase [Roseimicrobium gellanilyticum]|uniref:histidine kinase n=1 Tax=Roseimicrobium gellanilyticum TaxID=748857 RepID=A0A366HU15_9BACT|nr:response regulator [Roseimicrobium gellanilyticum]RBP47776.1 signal transduction histidine kinase [Roseimicrobium gellanilyticum]